MLFEDSADSLLYNKEFFFIFIILSEAAKLNQSATLQEKLKQRMKKKEEKELREKAEVDKAKSKEDEFLQVYKICFLIFFFSTRIGISFKK